MIDTKYWRVELHKPCRVFNDDPCKFKTENEALDYAREMALATPGEFFTVLESMTVVFEKVHTPTMKVIMGVSK